MFLRSKKKQKKQITLFLIAGNNFKFDKRLPV